MKHGNVSKSTNQKSRELCKYIANVYRQRREELGLTREEVASLIHQPVSVVTKSENSLRIGLDEVFTIGRNVYGLDMPALLEEAEAHVKTILCPENPPTKE